MFACDPTPDPDSASGGTTYTNPVGPGLLMGDPYVLLHAGRYYLYGTTDPPVGFRCYTSDNLADWTEVGFAYRRKPDEWGDPPFWAPEVKCFKGRFYMTYSARDPGTDRLLTALAASDRPEGPYENLHAPWFDPGYSVIDADIFIDDDETPFLYFSRNGMQDGYSYGMIYGAPLKADLTGLAAEPILLMQAEQDWERINYAEKPLQRGPFRLKTGWRLLHDLLSQSHLSRWLRDRVCHGRASARPLDQEPPQPDRGNRPFHRLFRRWTQRDHGFAGRCRTLHHLPYA